MTEPTLNPTKVKALELAVQAGGAHDEVVKRAQAYHIFLGGSTAAPAGAATTGKPGTGAPAGGKPGAATTGKPGATTTATTGKPGAATTAGKPGAAPTGAPAGGKPAAKAAGAPTGAAVAGDTKAPGGTNAYSDVVNKLREVQADPDLGRDKAFAILAKAGGGVKSVRDLKPTNYDAVVAGCNNALNGEGDNAGEGDVDGLGGGDFEDPTASAPRDEAGL